MLPGCLNRLTNRFAGYDYCVDLYATRSPADIPTKYVLTTRLLFSFAKSMRSLEANVIEAIPGEGIYLSKKEDLRWDWRSELITRQGNHAYFSRGQLPSLRAWIRSKLAVLLK